MVFIRLNVFFSMQPIRHPSPTCYVCLLLDHQPPGIQKMQRDGLQFRVTMRYTNRVGKTYYLREGKTKTGNPQYFFSTQQDGNGKAVTRMPDGYEIYEHPENAQVFLRKKQRRLITDIEEQLVKKQVSDLRRSRRYLVDCKDKYITIYESNVDIGQAEELLKDCLTYFRPHSGMNVDQTMTTLVNVYDKNYTPLLRFYLTDKAQRLFRAERYCFRGAIDDWISLGGSDHFRNLVEKYVNILGTDKFFDAPHL